MRHLTLREYESAPATALTTVEVAALAEAAPWVEISPATGHPGKYDLRPGSHIGAVTLDSLALEIRPKLPIQRVLFLLSYSLDPRLWKQTGFDFQEQDSLVEAIIPGFVTQIRRAFRRGILQGYRTQEEALLTVRGRIRFDDQIRDRFGIFPPVEVRYDEFTDDITENRLIKAAISRLGRLRIRSNDARRSLRSFDSLLENVQLAHFDWRKLPEIHYTRLNAHYRPAVELAKLILRATGFELGHGKVAASSFLVDMNKVFEDFVVVAIRDALGVSDRTFPQGCSQKHLALDDAGRVRLEPDISWWDGNVCTFVGDVKYKRINAAGVKHADIYQLLAYTVAANLPAGLLIYAAGEEPAVHQVKHLGKSLEVRTLDLGGQPEDILATVQAVADRIVEMRRGVMRNRRSIRCR